MEPIDKKTLIKILKASRGSQRHAQHRFASAVAIGSVRMANKMTIKLRKGLKRKLKEREQKIKNCRFKRTLTNFIRPNTSPNLKGIEREAALPRALLLKQTSSCGFTSTPPARQTRRS